ncbi:MAG: hypothetical protein V1817_01870 [Candidatus Micrarchaeota archaeon]
MNRKSESKEQNNSTAATAFTILAVFLVLTGALFLYGCVNSGPGQDNGMPQGGLQGGFTNMTAEQRQALADERQRLAESACAGKNEGDACAMQFARGGGSVPNSTARNFNAGNQSNPRNFTPSFNPSGRPPNAFGGNGTGGNGVSENATGTCETQEGKLLCVIARQGGQAPLPSG